MLVSVCFYTFEVGKCYCILQLQMSFFLSHHKAAVAAIQWLPKYNVINCFDVSAKLHLENFLRHVLDIIMTYL